VRTAERRDELVRLLRRRTSWTLEALADQLKASRRTIARDVDALRDRGFEVRGTTGPGGGLRLEPTSVMVSSQLATEEVVGLVLSVAVARATSSMPFAAGAESAIKKIESALPPQRASQLQIFMERVLVGDSYRDCWPAHAVDARFLAVFEEAFTTRRTLSFAYQDRNGRRTRREVEPHGLLVRPPVWYAIAWDTRKDAPRLFRADRVRRPEVNERQFLPRPDQLVTGVCPDARPSGSRRSESRR